MLDGHSARKSRMEDGPFGPPPWDNARTQRKGIKVFDEYIAKIEAAERDMESLPVRTLLCSAAEAVTRYDWGPDGRLHGAAESVHNRLPGCT
jgi:hypothetical protein